MATPTQVAIDQARPAMARVNNLFNTEVFEKRNYDALDEIYTSDAPILPPGAPLAEGRAAIKEFWSKLIEAVDARSGVLRSVDIMPAGDGIIEIGSAKLTMGAQVTEMEVKYVVFWKMEEGKWKWHVDIWNQNE
jgi:ketosteroid isomerase-like protein